MSGNLEMCSPSFNVAILKPDILCMSGNHQISRSHFKDLMWPCRYFSCTDCAADLRLNPAYFSGGLPPLLQDPLQV